MVVRKYFASWGFRSIDGIICKQFTFHIGKWHGFEPKLPCQKLTYITSQGGWEDEFPFSNPLLVPYCLPYQVEWI